MGPRQWVEMGALAVLVLIVLWALWQTPRRRP